MNEKQLSTHSALEKITIPGRVLYIHKVVFLWRLILFFFLTEPELSCHFYMAPKSTDIYNDVPLGFSALFATCSCTQALRHLCFWKDRKSVAMSSTENILELQLKEICKGSFICLGKKKKKKIHRDLTIPMLIYKWYTVFMSLGATKASQQTLRVFAK